MPKTKRCFEGDLAANSVPESLRALRLWVCWRYIERRGKPTKCPINPTTGDPASSTDPSTWASFEEALAAYEHSDDLSGIGFVFTGDDSFAGVDLDGCIVDGKIVPEAEAIIKALNSYTEISPSGNGVKSFIKAIKPKNDGSRSEHVTGFDHAEVYDDKRFFVVTGRRVMSTPPIVEPRQQELDDLCHELFPSASRSTSRNGAPSTSGFTCEIDMAERESRCRAYLDRCPDAISGQGGHNSTLRAACECYRFGLDEAAAWRVMRWFNDRKTGNERWSDKEIGHKLGSARLKIEGAGEYGARLLNGTADPRESSGPQTPQSASYESRLPVVLIATDEHRVVQETIAALDADRDLYQRGNILTRVIRDQQPTDGIIRCEGSATIQAVPAPNLRERMTSVARFARLDRNQEIVPAHPPNWLVNAVAVRGEWRGIRHLMGVSDTPVLRADGSVWQNPGYDARTCVLFEPARCIKFTRIKSRPTRDDAKAAWGTLAEVICDFPFETDEHKAAWLAALLTPLARFAFAGPSPLFLIDANVRGAGKGLLAQSIARIVLGREMPVSSYSHDSDEMRKKLTAIAIAGDQLILFDNLEGNFGNDALDRALTSTRWKDRILGKSEEIELPLIPAWYGTGNNVQVAADTMRRIIHVRLDCLDESPEERSQFRHENLLAWIDANRGELLSSALTILAAYLRSGAPRQDLKPFGSFEGWSKVVRGSVVWLGLPDPCLTRIRLAESSDTTLDALTQLIMAWRRYDHLEEGVVVSEMLNFLYPSQREDSPKDDSSVAMRGALENLVGCPPGKSPTARQVGKRLSNYRRRVVSGMYFDFNPKEYARGGTVWRLQHVQRDA